MRVSEAASRLELEFDGNAAVQFMCVKVHTTNTTLAQPTIHRPLTNRKQMRSQTKIEVHCRKCKSFVVAAYANANANGRTPIP